MKLPQYFIQKRFVETLIKIIAIEHMTRIVWLCNNQ